MPTDSNTQFSEQNLDNRSFNDTYEIYENLGYGYDSTTGTIKAIKTDSNGQLVTTSPAFAPNADITTEINGDIITQTDGVKTLTITIDGNTITEEWS